MAAWPEVVIFTTTRGYTAVGGAVAYRTAAGRVRFSGRSGVPCSRLAPSGRAHRTPTQAPRRSPAPTRTCARGRGRGSPPPGAPDPPGRARTGVGAPAPPRRRGGSPPSPLAPPPAPPPAIGPALRVSC